MRSPPDEFYRVPRARAATHRPASTASVRPAGRTRAANGGSRRRSEHRPSNRLAACRPPTSCIPVPPTPRRCGRSAAGTASGPRPSPPSDFPVDVAAVRGLRLAARRRLAGPARRDAQGPAGEPAARGPRPPSRGPARRPARLRLAHGRRLDLAAGPAVMGVLNVTPDSFSDGGAPLRPGPRGRRAPSRCSRRARRSWTSAASRRAPRATARPRQLSADEEISRVVPVIAGIRAKHGRAALDRHAQGRGGARGPRRRRRPRQRRDGRAVRPGDGRGDRREPARALS